VAITSLAGSAKTAVRSNASSPVSSRPTAAAPAKRAPLAPARSAQALANRYFDLVVLVSVLMFILLAAGVGLLVMQHAAGWRI
jgi:hypothetical protein